MDRPYTRSVAMWTEDSNDSRYRFCTWEAPSCCGIRLVD